MLDVLARDPFSNKTIPLQNLKLIFHGSPQGSLKCPWVSVNKEPVPKKVLCEKLAFEYTQIVFPYSTESIRVSQNRIYIFRDDFKIRHRHRQIFVIFRFFLRKESNIQDEISSTRSSDLYRLTKLKKSGKKSKWNHGTIKIFLWGFPSIIHCT